MQGLPRLREATHLLLYLIIILVSASAVVSRLKVGFSLDPDFNDSLDEFLALI